MDLCINRDISAGATLSEVREGLRVMEDARDSSPMGRRFHESLLNILRKHNVHLPTIDAAPPTNNPHIVQSSTNGLMNVPADPMSVDLSIPSAGFVFDGMWQDFLNSGPTLNPQEWDALLSDLDMQPM